MPIRPLHRLFALGRAVAQGRRRRLPAATHPMAAPLAVGALADLARSESALVAENAFPRHQLAIPRCGVARPRCTRADRARPVALAGRFRAWPSAPPLVRPAEQPVRRQHQLLRGHWRRRSRVAAPAHRPPLAPETVASIRALALANRPRGAGRIRGGLLKRDIRVAKSTVQRHLREARPPRRGDQSRATFPRDHAPDIRACDSLPVTDFLIRPFYACFIVARGTRRARPRRSTSVRAA